VKAPPTLKVCVQEVVVVREGTAPRAVKRHPKPSPYFQPEMTFRVEREVDWSTTKPRGPTVFIEMGDLMAAFD
jgi:hypothetical protein